MKMTKKDVFDYIDSLHKEAGEFTDEELYTIGTMYKDLPTSEKRWNELVEVLGVLNEEGEPKTGEQFRLWLKDRQYADGSIKKNIQLISGQTIDDISFDEFENKTSEIKRDLYIQQQKTRDEHNSYRRTLRDEARIQEIKDLMASSIKELKDLPKVKYTKATKKCENEAVMLISDLHIGMEIDNFANKYNTEIAKKRLMSFVDETIQLCKDNHVKRLNICNLSDLIHGYIHVTGRIEEEEDAISQIMIASEILAEAMTKLQAAAPEIVYRSVTDNHSRAIADYKQHIEKENFSRLIDFYLEPRLKGTNIVFANDNLDYDISKFQLLNGKVMVCSHGHRDNINTIIQGYIGATRQFIDYVAVGHYHESKMKSFQGAKVFVNGSICGSDSYAQSKRLYGDPEQTLLIFKGDTLMYNLINLQNVE